MGGIKYYQLAKGEELPDEFCAVRDVGGEPSEYTFYVPEVENAKLRELLAGDESQRRIAGIGEGVTPTYHSTWSVDEARLVVENVKLQK